MFPPIDLPESERIFSLFHVFVGHCAVGDGRLIREKHSVFVEVLHPTHEGTFRACFAQALSRQAGLCTSTRGAGRFSDKGSDTSAAHPKLTIGVCPNELLLWRFRFGVHNDATRPPGGGTTARERPRFRSIHRPSGPPISHSTKRKKARNLRTLRRSHDDGLRRAPVHNMRQR